jgi:integrase
MAVIDVLFTAGRAGSIRSKGAAGDVLRDTDNPDLRIIVGERSRTYFTRFRLKGQPKQYTWRLGTIDEIKLGDARDEVLRIKLEARQRRLPDHEKRLAEAAAKAQAEAEEAAERAAAKRRALTFKAVAEQFLDDGLKHGGANLASNAELRRKLAKDLVPLHDRAITEIEHTEIDKLIRAKAAVRGVAGNRLLSFVKQVFSYAMRRGLITVNPALKVDKPFEEPERERALSEDEIRTVWRAADKLGDPFGRLVKLLLVTGQRRGEVAGMRRSELDKPLRYEVTVVDAETHARSTVQAECPAWLIPKERMKGRKPHSVPLSGLAQELIDGAPVLLDAFDQRFEHVLATGAAGDAPITGWSKYRRQLDVAIAEVLAEEAGEEVDLERHRLAPFHLHDLRASVGTLMEERRGVPEQVIGRVFAHSPGTKGRTITRVYLRSPWHAEAYAALEDWAAELKRIVGLNVEQLGERRDA